MEVIDIGLSDLEPISFNLEEEAPRHSVNFGPGIELLMNDKKISSASSTSVDLGDLDKLENELNELSQNASQYDSSPPSTTKKVGGFADFFSFGGNKSAPTPAKEPETGSRLGSATAESVGNSKTWDGFGKVNDVPMNAAPRMNERDRRRKKRAMIKKLDEWYEKGHIKHTSNFNMESDYDEVEDEYETVMEDKRKKDSIKLQGWWFTTLVNSMEYANAVFDPFGLNLDGWGEQINEDIESYEEIFSELHDKYKGGKMSPEVSLLLRLGFSGAVLNITNKALSTATPGFNDVIRQSPELMRMFSNATAETMKQTSPGFEFVNSVLHPEEQVKTTFGAPPAPVETKGQGQVPRPGMQYTAHPGNRPDISMGRGSMFQEQGVDMSNPHENVRVQQRTAMQAPPKQPMQGNMQGPRAEMRGPQSVDLEGLLTGLKTREVNMHQQSSAGGDENDSMVSISSLKDAQNGQLPKRTNRRKQRSDKNTISLDI